MMSRVNTNRPTGTPSAETKKGGFGLKKVLPLIVLAAGIAAVFAFDLDQYVTFEVLRENRGALTNFVADNPLAAPLVFMVIYAAVVALSLPGGAIMTIAGGWSSCRIISITCDS